MLYVSEYVDQKLVVLVRHSSINLGGDGVHLQFGGIALDNQLLFHAFAEITRFCSCPIWSSRSFVQRTFILHIVSRVSYTAKE